MTKIVNVRVVDTRTDNFRVEVSEESKKLAEWYGESRKMYPNDVLESLGICVEEYYDREECYCSVGNGSDLDCWEYDVSMDDPLGDLLAANVFSDEDFSGAEELVIGLTNYFEKTDYDTYSPALGEGKKQWVFKAYAIPVEDDDTCFKLHPCTPSFRGDK